MPQVRVYMDTSVFGGTQDEEFRRQSEAVIDQVDRGRYLLLISEVTLAEPSGAPAAVQRAFFELPTEHIIQVPVSDEVERLADAYLAAGVLGQARRADALHVAAVTVARADVIVSWNFKDIVNYQRIHQFNGVNALNGYPELEVRSPLEMTNADQDEDI
jgi:predicted nucleic acid-binding protein